MHNLRPYRIALVTSGILFMLGASCAAAAGCNVVAGLDKDYRAAIPDGWDGPFSINESIAEPAGCQDGFVEVEELHSGLNIPPAATLCNCQAPAEACQPLLHIVAVPIGECQVAFGVDELLEPGVCVGIDMVNEYARADEPEPAAIGCHIGEGAQADPTWALNVRVCQGIAGTCIRRVGDVECPVGPFSQKKTFFVGQHDTRECNCGQVTGVCAGSVALYGDDVVYPGVPDFPQTTKEACEWGMLVTAKVLFGVCTEKVSADYVRYNLLESSLSCDVTEGEAFSGTVVPASPVTVCCQP